MTYKPKRLHYGRRAYIGNYQGEELFLMPIKWDCGWYWGGVYLEGLRPENEETLKEQSQDCELSDYYDVKNIPYQYLNEEAFKQDMRNDWQERHDTQIQQERGGVDYYLGFGSHTHADSVLLKDCKGEYSEALKVFDKLYISKENFKVLIKLLKDFYKYKERKKQDKTYLRMMEKAETTLQEYEQFIQHFPELPPKDFWINPEQ